MTTHPRKKKVKTARQLIIKANDDIFRAIIRKRDKVCQMTRGCKNLQVCHYWTRSILRTRWDMTNAVLLNSGKHIFFAHKYPDKFKEWFIKHIGQEEFDKLELKARYSAPIKIYELQMMNIYLRQKLEEIN